MRNGRVGHSYNETTFVWRRSEQRFVGNVT